MILLTTAWSVVNDLNDLNDFVTDDLNDLNDFVTNDLNDFANYLKYHISTEYKYL